MRRARTGAGSARAAGLLLLAALGAGLAWVLAGLPAHEAALRYALLALVPLAVAPTHALLPDPALPWLQRLNPPPGALLRRALARWTPVVAALAVPGLLAAARAGALAGGLALALALAGAGLVALADTLALGPVSQAWQEGRRGGAYRRLVARAPQASLQVPHGALPAMFASLKTYVFGAAAVLGGTFAEAAAPGTAWAPPAALAAWGAWRLHRLAPRLDAAYYHTSALYTELFRGAERRLGRRPDLAPEAVYWVPRRWRPHAWAGLVQMDRVLPLGRFVALGAVGLAALAALGADPAVLHGAVALGLVARNATILRHADPALSPPTFHLHLAGPADWVVVRTGMNVRWTPPTALALGLLALLGAPLGWSAVLGWLAADLALAVLFALAATHAAEHRLRRRYA